MCRRGKCWMCFSVISLQQMFSTKNVFYPSCVFVTDAASCSFFFFFSWVEKNDVLVLKQNLFPLRFLCCCVTGSEHVTSPSPSAAPQGSQPCWCVRYEEKKYKFGNIVSTPLSLLCVWERDSRLERGGGGSGGCRCCQPRVLSSSTPTIIVFQREEETSVWLNSAFYSDTDFFFFVLLCSDFPSWGGPRSEAVSSSACGRFLF